MKKKLLMGALFTLACLVGFSISWLNQSSDLLLGLSLSFAIGLALGLAIHQTEDYGRFKVSKLPILIAIILGMAMRHIIT